MGLEKLDVRQVGYLDPVDSSAFHMLFLLGQIRILATKEWIIDMTMTALLHHSLSEKLSLWRRNKLLGPSVTHLRRNLLLERIRIFAARN